MCYKFSCSKDGVTYIGMYECVHGFRMLQNFVPSAQKYETNEIQSGVKISAITLVRQSNECYNILNPFTATGYFDIPPPRWPTFLVTLFPILKEGMGLSLSDEFEVQYHVIKK